MSDRIGPVAVLPRPGSGPLLPGVSESSQRSLVLVDEEVRRIVEESQTSVLDLLRTNRWRLDALASALLKDETLDGAAAYAAAGLPEPGSAPGTLTAVAFGASPPAA
jgi:cell division protease FtsH